MIRIVVAALALIAQPAFAACNINKIAGTYEVQVTRQYYYIEDTTTCWFEIGRNTNNVGNLRISCIGTASDYYGYFGFSSSYSETPWHQLRRVRGQDVVPNSVRKIDPCRWQIVDRNGVEGIDYNVTFASDGQSLIGTTVNVYHWLTGYNVTFVLNGVRQ